MLCCWLRCTARRLVELAHFGINSDFLHDRGIARGDGLDLGIGKRPAFEVLGAAHRGVAGHHLLDEAGLGLQGLPHIGVERAFRDVAVNLHFRIKIALAQNSSLALLEVARAPGRVEVMQRAQVALDVHPCPHFFGRADHDAHPAGVEQAAEKGFPPPAPSLLSLPEGGRFRNEAIFRAGCGATKRWVEHQTYFSAPCQGVEEIHLGLVAVGVVDEGDGVVGNAGGGQP